MPLPSAATFTNLPTYTTAFIGRGYHIKAVSSLLQQETTHLLTLLGPGGIGKTRLSVKVAEELPAVFEDGVCFVSLDSVTDHHQVSRQIGIQLGLKESFNNSWDLEIIHFLAKKQLLLILDNFEQVLGAVSVIAQILRACPRVKVLVTSRETLGLSSEIEYLLDSLNRPNPKLFPGPKDLLKFDAVQLFVQQAQTTLPHFRLTADNAAAVVGICDLLDGLPLPIELAAARLKLFSPEVIFLKLSTDTALLKSGAKDVVPRHQTIRNTVKWSYDLLEPDEKILFQKLSLFRGGFTLDALEAVCTGLDALQVLESFINKSLIVKDREVHFVPRFRMLKLIREYGLEQLYKNPEKSSYYEKFTQYFLSFAEQGKVKPQSAEQVKWMAMMEAEYENLLVALEWLIFNQPESAAKMGSSFWLFHLHRGLLREGLAMIETLLDLSIEEETTSAKLVEAAGALSHNLGKYLNAKDYFKRSLDLNQHLGHKIEIAKALNNVSWAEWRIGNYDLTMYYAEQALSIFTELNDALGQAKSLNNLAWAFHYRGQFEEAARLQGQVLDMHTKAENKHGIAFAKVNLGRALMKSGKRDEAAQLIQHGTQAFEDLNSRQLIAFAYLIEAEYAYEIKDYPTAKAALVDHCLPGFEKIGDIWGVANCHNNLGKIYHQEKAIELAKSHLDKSLELFRSTSDRFGEADACMCLSRLYRSKDQDTKADELLQQGLTLAAEMNAAELLTAGHLEMQQFGKSPTSEPARTFPNGGRDPSQTTEEPVNALDAFFIQQVRNIIVANLANPHFTIKDLCREVGISHSQLHRRLSAATGQSITQFIRAIRLHKAQELLLDPRVLVAAVAYDTGFRDPDYFHRIFKKAFHMTPTEYRKLVCKLPN